ncbi:hypothetical protein TRFO_04282 [Tritrichomonas foetus]|uniref:Leucine Rich Repeat family protein n=1 Tax=Tritrichomonas foetus TaxID=1144522 RepID=A0A1J4KH28_9EUKA|nr:hypothetical protein TRFO_04282 [Tritrichomonas foetus]|eukprot:OHT10264.1 hypothetical protein TRFO_04282 [Tritrichomonas foetus]
MEAADLHFQNFVPNNPNLRLTHEEITEIAANLPKGQHIIHFALRSPVRLNRKEIQGCLTVLSNHFVLCLRVKSDENDKIYVLSKIHICDIQMLAYSKDKEVLIKCHSVNLRLLDDGQQLNRRFMQIMYRNFQIIYAAYDKISSALELRADDMSYFPDINIHISPSQKFQFLYYALCSKCDTIFHQDVVRFIHTMVLSGMSVVDLSQLPIDQYGQNDEGYDLKPIFRALSMMKFVSGVCCTGTERPTIMEEVQSLLEYSQKLQIIHIANCGATSGLTDLLQAARKKEGLPIQYWNISGNNFSDFEAFVTLLEVSKDPILFLDVSNCEISAKNAEALFNTLQVNKNLHQMQQLHIAGIEMNEDSFYAFDSYLSTLVKRSISDHSFQIPLKSLNIGNTKHGLVNFLQSLNKSPMPLSTLILADSNVDQAASDTLITLIKSSTTLRCLDMSGTRITAENVADIIFAISKNPKLHNFDLRINRLELKTGNLLPIFRVFLSGNLKRWHAISLDGNEMDQDDLRNILPLLTLMKKLRYLSLNDNFDSSMKNIDILLPQLLNIPSLKSISLACKNSDHKLHDKLIPFIVELRKHQNVKEIDISGNSIGDDGLSALIHYIRSDKEVESISFDGSDPKSIDLLSELSLLIKGEDHKKLISLDFPVKDAANLLKSFSGQQLKDGLQRMSNIQLSIVNTISVHRAQMGVTGKLPFEATKEIKDLIRSISNNTRQGFLANEKPLEHSCICEEFGLPLPYQKMGDIVIDGGRIIERNVGDELGVYSTPDFYKYIEEEKSHYVVTDNLLDETSLTDSRMTSAESSSVALPSIYSESQVRSMLLKKAEEEKKRKDEEANKKKIKNNSTNTDDSTTDSSRKRNKKNPKNKRTDPDSTFDLPPTIRKRSSRVTNNVSSSDDEDDTENNRKLRNKKKSRRLIESSSSEDERPNRNRNKSSRITSNSKYNRNNDSDSDSGDINQRRKSKKQSRRNIISDSDEEELPPPSKVRNSSKKQLSRNRRNISDSDSEDDVRLSKKQQQQQKSKKKVLYSDSDSEDEQVPKRRQINRRNRNSEDSSEDSSDIPNRRKLRNFENNKKKSNRQRDSTSDEESSEDSRPPRRNIRENMIQKKSNKGRASPRHISDSDSEGESDSDEYSRRKKSPRQQKNNRRQIYSDSEENDDSDEIYERNRNKRKQSQQQQRRSRKDIVSSSSSEEDNLRVRGGRKPNSNSKNPKKRQSDSTDSDEESILSGLAKKPLKKHPSKESFEMMRPAKSRAEEKPWEMSKNRKKRF